MPELFDLIEESKTYLIAQGIEEVDVAIVLGTGLGKLVEQVNIECKIAYKDIPHFPISTVEFHEGFLVYGELEGKHILAMSGRFHYYEGHSFVDVTYGIRVFKALNAKALLLSGAAGSMNLKWQKGDLMLLSDHIHLLPGNPLIGPNDERLGTRFPDMSVAYNQDLRRIILEEAELLKQVVREGVYVSAQGSMLESPAEYRFLHRIGADAVGMSTTPEVIVANHAGLPCTAVVVLTDECDPDHLEPIHIPTLLKVAGEAELKLIELFKRIIQRI